MELVTSEFNINEILSFKLPQLSPKKHSPGRFSLNSKSILIVDDSLDNLEIITMFLNSFSGITDTACSGDEALAKIQNCSYDVVLMDIEMPHMNGFELIEKFRQSNMHTPVIALTAHDLLEDRQRTKNAGFCAHVAKPIDFNSLVHSIKNS